LSGSIREEQMDSSLARTHSTRRYAWWLAPVVVVLALAGAWTARASILRGVAEWWVISDPLDRADGIVVLGGRMDVRPFAAADLFKRGLAPQILIANVMRDPLEAMQLWPGQTALTRQLLLKLGVPAEAIVEFGDEVSSTYEEARAVLDWAKRSGAKTVIIPTDSFPTRRVRWTFQQEVAPAGVRIIVHAIKPRGYDVKDWWKDERGLIDFQNEVIKFVHYRLKY
jgi:uncharacterized SAM-binding protein YcdF (DUF218 family)